MSNKSNQPLNFWELLADDKDLTMFSMIDLSLEKEENANMVFMALKLKRKVVTELVTTYLPTFLLLLITFVTIFFDRNLFGDAIAVNLTIMLVMTTIFTSKIEELPPTSDMKMIDIWLIGCLVVPFLEVILRTAIENLNPPCNEKEKTAQTEKAKIGHEDNKKRGEPIEESSPGVAAQKWAKAGGIKDTSDLVAFHKVIVIQSDAQEPTTFSLADTV